MSYDETNVIEDMQDELKKLGEELSEFLAKNPAHLNNTRHKYRELLEKVGDRLKEIDKIATDFFSDGEEEDSEAKLRIDFDEKTEEWLFRCHYEECGGTVLSRTPGTDEEHAKLVKFAVDHEKAKHGGDGIMPSENVIALG